jgi:membrane protein implicated in regulation of membrane protease activity
MTGFGLETLPMALRYMGALFVWFGFIAATTFVMGEVPQFAAAAQFAFLFAFAAALTALLLRRSSKPAFVA